jgi:anti-sigma factor ChrR (cupin superfamily)
MLGDGKVDPSPQLPKQPPSEVRARLRVIPSLWGPDIDYAMFAWEPLEPGVEIFPLYGDKSKRAAAALLRYEAGARVPRHKHSDWEPLSIPSARSC